jgi:hypothetical protein
MHIGRDMARAQNIDLAGSVRRTAYVHAAHGIVTAEDDRATGERLRVGDVADQDAWNIC